MRRSCTTLVVLIVLMTGIGAGAAGASTPAGGKAPGVTDDEIHIGITYVDLSNLGDTIGIEFGDWQEIYEAVIDDLNAKGGINGRKLRATFAPVEPIGTVPAEKACVKLTEDEKVFAVTGFFLGDAPLCYLEQHATPVVNGTITKAGLKVAKAPWFSLQPDYQTDALAIDAFKAAGAFKGGKLGIVVDVQSQQTYDDVVKPALERNKVKGTVANITATTGDAAETERQASVIAEQFRSQGINKVLFVGTSALQFGNALAKTDYRPRLIVLSQPVLRAFVQNPGSALEVAETAITAAPVVNFDDPALQDCFDVVTEATGYEIKETVTANEPDYRSSAEIACRSIGLFSAIAEAAGDNLTVKTFGDAPKKGPLKVPGSGPVTYNAKTKTFEQPIYIWRYDEDTKTLVPDDEPVT